MECSEEGEEDTPSSVEPPFTTGGTCHHVVPVAQIAAASVRTIGVPRQPSPPYLRRKPLGQSPDASTKRKDINCTCWSGCQRRPLRCLEMRSLLHT